MDAARSDPNAPAMSTDSGTSFNGNLVQGYAPAASRPGFSEQSLVSKLRLIPQIDKDPRFAAYVQRLSGRILLFGAFAVLLSLLGGSLFIAPLAAACAYAERHRRYLIPLATLLLLYQNGFWVDVGLVGRVAEQEGVANQINQPLLFCAMLALVFLLFSCLLAFWHRLVAFPLLRRSTLCLILCFVSLVLLAQSPIVAGVTRVLLWSFLMTSLPYVWFLAYALADAGGREQAPFWQRLGFFHPFWGSTLTPFGKGLSYLRRFEATTPENLAVTQLKGLKLAVWALLLAACRNCIGSLVHGYLGLPYFDDTFSQYILGTPYPRYLCWTSLALFFVEDVLTISLWGGIIIASARMAGFRLLRNTYRPLEAKTLAEFWNRYYFYYKELLVDHFFYPAFLRYFRTNRRLRMFFATFAAACVGNLIFHFIRDIRFVAELGLWKALSGEQSHAFYTFVLATGVAFSQMRVRRPDACKGWLRGRVLPAVGVAAFFCILHIFDAPLDREHTIWQRACFLFHLFGADTWT
jgi:hypothetical protein